MGAYGQTEPPDYLVVLGDNFYKHGVDASSASVRFSDTFESVYTAPSLQVPWYVIAGNHDQ